MPFLKNKLRGAAALLVAGLMLAGALACGEYYLDPGPNPARIRVKLWAMVPAKLKQVPSEWIYWDWSLRLVVPKGAYPMLPPTVKQDFYTIPNTNPLVRDVTFLAPPGKRKYLLEVYGYAIRQRGEHSGPKILTYLQQTLELDLPPGGSYLIERRVGGQ
ncbi:MAG: hypothetical protein K9K66_08535 [Desulfarculaceae bacterium]|nr:hypothetical protein [Desulfarculaceae bacterium]MCF8071367.1 hypothetical protein [Desulfarculaceae bacterium]MCF8101692.1 hypothetical protein [Desulfarculaceae bacterium]MCF8116699.1 hypothetical protein [Desulfarculaceae bacterium]